MNGKQLLFTASYEVELIDIETPAPQAGQAQIRLRFADLVREIHSSAETPEVYTRFANEKAFPLVEFDWRKL